MTCISSHPLGAPATASIFFNLWNPHQATAAGMPRLRLIPLGDTGTTAGSYSLQYCIPGSPSDDVWPVSDGTGAGTGHAGKCGYSLL